MPVDLGRAATLLREEGARANEGEADPRWVAAVRELSEACEKIGVRTYVAFLGTAMLGKAADIRNDAYSVKIGEDPVEGAYNARDLCRDVLKPIAVELGANLGVTGREPLNNMPFFRMVRILDPVPVAKRAMPLLQMLKRIVADIDAITDEAEARAALRAFIYVRKGYQPTYTVLGEAASLTVDEFIRTISEFVLENSEGGRRAQAIVAGVLDACAGQERVETKRVNDPSRHYPGDVCVSGESVGGVWWEKAFEVKDRSVPRSEVLVFGERCLVGGVREAAVVAVSPSQQPLDIPGINGWAARFGIGLTVFQGWDAFVRQALFWAQSPQPEAVLEAIPYIHQRLIDLEVSQDGVARWAALVHRKPA